jgi:rare lipoprotein A
MVCTLPHSQAATASPAIPGHPDLTGTTRVGKASFYAQSFAYRLMADGRKMNPRSDNAASRTLPLGSTAKVTNVQTGQTAVVTIEDRGPYVKGRILDLSPATARKIGITRRLGLAQVKIAPISVALPDGTTKPGSGAHQVPNCRIYASSAEVLALVNREPQHAFSEVAAR